VVFPGLAPLTDRSRWCGSPRELDLPFKALERRRESALADPSSRGIRKVCPLADIPTARPLPGAEAPSREPKPPSARWVPAIRSRSVLVVSHHLDGFLRAEVAGLLHPAARQGFVAFHAHRGQKPEAVRRRSGARDPRGGAPRDAVHTLRSLPFADSRAASLRPLPPCRYRPAEAGRRSDSVMLRSAEADPHVTEHEVPSRRRSDAGQPRTTPDGRSRTGARRGPGDQTRAGVGPPRALTLDPRANVRRRRLSCCRDRSRGAWRGAASRPPKRAGCGSVESSRSGSASRPCSVDEVRCRQVTVAGDRRSFLPWALFPFEVPSCCRCVPAVPGRRPPRPKPRRADPRRPTRKRVGGGGSAGSLCGFTRGAGPKPFVATARGRPKPGHGPAPFQRGGRGPRVVTPRVSRPKPVSPRSQCPESLSGARVVRGWSAMPSNHYRHRSDGREGRAPQGVLTDLHGVFDVKDRSEEQPPRSDPASASRRASTVVLMPSWSPFSATRRTSGAVISRLMRCDLSTVMCEKLL
jgi:hypothetical protein